MEDTEEVSQKDCHHLPRPFFRAVIPTYGENEATGEEFLRSIGFASIKVQPESIMPVSIEQRNGNGHTIGSPSHTMQRMEVLNSSLRNIFHYWRMISNLNKEGDSQRLLSPKIIPQSSSYAILDWGLENTSATSQNEKMRLATALDSVPSREARIKSKLECQRKTEAEIIEHFRQMFATLIITGKALHVNPYLILGVNGIGLCRYGEFGCEVESVDVDSFNAHSQTCVFSFFTRCMMIRGCTYSRPGSLNGLEDLVKHLEDDHDGVLQKIQKGVTEICVLADPNDSFGRHLQWPFVIGKLDLEFLGFTCQAIIMQHCIPPHPNEVPHLFFYAVLVNRNRNDYLVNVAFSIHNEKREIVQPRGYTGTTLTEKTFTNEVDFYKSSWNYDYAYPVQSLYAFFAKSVDYSPITKGNLIPFLLSFDFTFLRCQMPKSYMENTIKYWKDVGVSEPGLAKDLVRIKAFNPTHLQSIVAPAVPIKQQPQKSIIFEMRDSDETRVAVFTPIVNWLLEERNASSVVNEVTTTIAAAADANTAAAAAAAADDDDDDKDGLASFNPKVIIIVPTTFYEQAMYDWLIEVYFNSRLNIVRSSKVNQEEDERWTGKKIDIWIGTPTTTYTNCIRQNNPLTINKTCALIAWRCDRLFSIEADTEFERIVKIIKDSNHQMNFILQYNDRFDEVSRTEASIFQQPSMPDVVSIGPTLIDGLQDLQITVYEVEDYDSQESQLLQLLQDGCGLYKTQYVFTKAYICVQPLMKFLQKALPPLMQVFTVEDHTGDYKQERVKFVQNLLALSPASILISTAAWLGGKGFPQPDRIIMYGVPSSFADFLGIMHACVGESEGENSSLVIIEPKSGHQSKGLPFDFMQYVRMAQGRDYSFQKPTSGDLGRDVLYDEDEQDGDIRNNDEHLSADADDEDEVEAQRLLQRATSMLNRFQKEVVAEDDRSNSEDDDD